MQLCQLGALLNLCNSYCLKWPHIKKPTGHRRWCGKMLLYLLELKQEPLRSFLPPLATARGSDINTWDLSRLKRDKVWCRRSASAQQAEGSHRSGSRQRRVRKATTSLPGAVGWHVPAKRNLSLAATSARIGNCCFHCPKNRSCRLLSYASPLMSDLKPQRGW